jgi:alkanesulfonate monooxygenase SsuD/methylene tetrahydromethanopterin reductase-like flavin-dependent oxidoreductase (luciferase family)
VAGDAAEALGIEATEAAALGKWPKAADNSAVGNCAIRGLSSIKEGGTGDRIDKCAWASSSAMARREKLTLRELYYRVAAARGHLLLIGTGTEIADVLERWFRAGIADGFNVMPHRSSPGSSTPSPPCASILN